MANIPSAILKMNDVEIAQDAPVTESLFTKIGANINGLIDENNAQDVTIAANYAALAAVDAGLDSRIDAIEAFSPYVVKSTELNTTFTVSSINPTFADITNLSATISVPSGLYVKLWIQPASGGDARITVNSTSSLFIVWDRNGSTIGSYVYGSSISSGGSITNSVMNPLTFIDTSPSAGSNTYKLRAARTSGTTAPSFSFLTLVAELIRY